MTTHVTILRSCSHGDYLRHDKATRTFHLTYTTHMDEVVADYNM